MNLSRLDASTRPELICPVPAQWQPVLLGQSVQGRPITLYHNLSALGLHDDVQLNTLIFSAIHGDEPESVVLAQAFLQQTITFDVPVGVITCLNPDGYLADTRCNANGVDLNRNFPTQNWQAEATDPAYPPGPSPASEPETQLLIQAINNYQPQKIISNHTPYRVINYDGPALEIAQAMADINNYPVDSDIGYATPGSFGTWAGKEKNIAVITLELPEKEEFTDTELANNILALNAVVKN